MNDSKKIFPYIMPAWVCWVAQDSNGIWWGYSVEPLRNDTGWYENEVGDYVRLGSGAPDDWQHSLQQVRSLKKG